jgi:hypothetical protein
VLVSKLTYFFLVIFYTVKNDIIFLPKLCPYGIKYQIQNEREFKENASAEGNK